MGLFDLFGSKAEREQEALRKLGRKLTERYGPAENRQKVIHQLGEMEGPAALRTLCQRFTIASEPGITDQEEKETTLRYLVSAGPAAVEPVTRFLREQEDGVGWALRALAEITPDTLPAIVVAELGRLSRTYTREPDKKLTLLGWLREHHDVSGEADAEATLLALLEDFSDDVRIAAARGLAAGALTEPVREGLIQLLLRDVDNARVRGEVLAALHQLKADVKGHRPSVEALLADPWFLDKDGVVKKRG
jgi:hypothetical protein